MSHPNQVLRVGIIGLGAIGQRLSRAFAAHPAFQVTAVCDADPEKVREQQETTGASGFHDYRDLLRSNLVDVVYVAVPPSLHREVTLAAFAEGKHVLCEKPLAVTTQEAQDMLTAARASGQLHVMQLPMYFSPGVHVFLEHLRSGAVGEVRRADITLVFPEWPRAWQVNPWIGKREQGGPIRECTPHLFEVVERALGPVRRVRADVQYPTDGVSSEESALAVLELESGVHVGLSLLCHVPRGETVDLTVYGTRGTLGLTNWASPVFAEGPGDLQPLPVTTDTPPGLLDELARALRGERADLPGFEVGARLQELQAAWEQAAASGEWTEVGRFT